MKTYGMIVVICMCVLLLSGCNIGGVKKTVEDTLQDIVKKDQQHEQGFVLSTEDIYTAFDERMGYLKLQNKGLTAIPDLCSLLQKEDHSRVKRLNLAQNKIRIVDQDLSCLLGLKSLNLSYNDIQVVETLGNLPVLEELLLQKNALTTTADFPEFPELKILNLAYNKLKEVKDLEHLQKLLVLELQHNVIEKTIGLEKLEQLKQLKVEFNKLQDGDISSLLDELKALDLFSANGNNIKDALLDELKKINADYVNKKSGTGDIVGTGAGE